MGTENRRLYSVGDPADDFLRPHPPHLTIFTARCALLLWTSSAMRRLDTYAPNGHPLSFRLLLLSADMMLMAQGHLWCSRLLYPFRNRGHGRRIHNGKPTDVSVRCPADVFGKADAMARGHFSARPSPLRAYSHQLHR